MKSVSALYNVTDVLDSHFTIFASPIITYSEALSIQLPFPRIPNGFAYIMNKILISVPSKFF
jgi:hypothetical protein